MSSSSEPKRSKRPAAGIFDEEELRELVEDDRVLPSLALVVRPEGEVTGDHWVKDAETNDILVDVELQPTGEVITCRLGGKLGGATGGMAFGLWAIPSLGAEVKVLIPRGDPHAGGVVVDVLSSGKVPAELNGTTVVLVIPDSHKLLIKRDGGTAEPLVTKSEFDAHGHDYTWTDPPGNGTTDPPDNSPISGTQAVESH